MQSSFFILYKKSGRELGTLVLVSVSPLRNGGFYKSTPAVGNLRIWFPSEGVFSSISLVYPFTGQQRPFIERLDKNL